LLRYRKEAKMAIKIGDIIPDFSLKDQDEKEFKMSKFRKKRILLSFHPLAWTSVCAKQMQSLEENFKTFKGLNTVPVGISVDSVPCKKAWADSLGLKNLRILSDFWPHGNVAFLLGLFIEKFGFSERANVIVDERGKVIFVRVYPIHELPDINEVIEFLKGD
jgi:peroxiredoxin